MYIQTLRSLAAGCDRCATVTVSSGVITTLVISVHSEGPLMSGWLNLMGWVGWMMALVGGGDTLYINPPTIRTPSAR